MNEFAPDLMVKFRQMVKQGSGRIINMSSCSGKKASPLEAAYCATKAAIIGLTKAMAELFCDLAGVGREETAAALPRVAVFKYSSQAILDEGIRGLLDSLRDHGYEDGRTMRLQQFNAENDLPTATSIARELTHPGSAPGMQPRASMWSASVSEP